MGERSKVIGEFGEDLVSHLLDLIGWKPRISNRDIPCNNSENHASKSKARREHGLDYIYSYKSSLEDDTLFHTIISSKYSTKQYPVPSKLVNDFKSYFNELAMAIECFRVSELKEKLSENSKRHKRVSYTGVLFWLSHGSEEDRSILDSLYNVQQIDNIDYGTIYLVDNERASFLYNSINYFYKCNNFKNVDFLYPANGNNNNLADRDFSGKILPCEYLTSGLIPFVLTDENGHKSIGISCINKFDDITLKRLIGLGNSISNALYHKLILLFPDFDELSHKEIVEEVLLSFTDQSISSHLEVRCLYDNFRSGTRI